MKTFPLRLFLMGHISVFQVNDPKSMNFFITSESFALAVKTQSCSKWKTKKLVHGFSFSFSINMANFEGFRQNIKLSSNLFFLKSEQVTFLIICHFLLLKKLYNRTFGKALFENLYLTIEKIRTMNLPQPSFQTKKSETHHSSTTYTYV